MNRLFYLLILPIFFLFFLALAPQNISFAVGEGQACSFGSRGSTITCDTGLACDVRNDTSTQCSNGDVCRGVCRQSCTINQGDPPGRNGGCGTNQTCDTRNSPSCNSFGCAGYCIANSSPQIPIGGTCTSNSSFGNARGNCLDQNAVCNTALDKSCSATSGMCTGICFPRAYQCQIISASNYLACPAGFSCTNYKCIPTANVPAVAVPPGRPPCAKPLVNGICPTVLTAIGLIDTNPGSFTIKIFGVLLGGSGFIALLLAMRAGYRIMSARGNPEGIKQGREQLVAALLGLLFLVFSFVLLQILGVDLLQIPNFSP